MSNRAMFRFVSLRATEPLPEVAADVGVAPIDARELARHAPDLHLMALDASGARAASGAHDVLRARCSCWWRDVPRLDGHTVGTIGHYAAALTTEPAAAAAGRSGADAGSGADAESAADAESGAHAESSAEAGSGADAGSGAAANSGAAASVALIEEACRRLRDAGCTIAIGPMDGNTWRRYRFVIERGEEPAFFLEPDHPDDWVRQFRAAGFSELATYTSALNENLAPDDARLRSGAAARLAARGVTIRPFDPAPARAEADLRRIYTLSIASFSRNYLYTPIGEAEFVEQYRSVLPVVRPELVLLAEHGDDLVGFLFAVPDMLQARRAGPSAVDTIIIKTVAVAPGATYAGLGSLLVGMVQREAHAGGYRRAIHALMHERNVSQNISRRDARTIRRYALFARPLV